MKLLIADDQLSVHRFFEKSMDFSRLGITRMLHAHDGAETLRIIREEKPDICILDIEMPVMNGISVLERLGPESRTKILILSAYDQFEYARQCMKYGVLDYILKPIDTGELARKLQGIIAQIGEENKQALETELLLLLAEDGDFPQTREDTAEIFRRLNIRQYGMVCSNQKDSSCPLFIKEKISPLLSFSFQQTCFYFFSMKDSGDWRSLYRLSAGTCRPRQLGFSLPQQSPSQLPICLRQCREALLQCFYTNRVSIYQENYFNSARTLLNSKPAKLLLDCAKSGCITQATETVEALFDDFAEKQIHPESVYEFCSAVLMYANSDGHTALNRPCYLPTQAMLIEGADEMKKRFLRALESQFERDRKTSARTDMEIVKEIKTYVDGHYDCDLSLENMEGLFFITKYQVSRIFKKLYGINYQDYLLQLRMEKAKSLLEDTTMKLYEVAQKTGFKEASYFSIVFKKYFGLSPHDFRLQSSDQKGFHRNFTLRAPIKEDRL